MIEASWTYHTRNMLLLIFVSKFQIAIEMEAINDNKSDIRRYGGTNEAEFFAVASEYFFEDPFLLQKNHPELYEMLSACFHKK